VVCHKKASEFIEKTVFPFLSNIFLATLCLQSKVFILAKQLNLILLFDAHHVSIAPKNLLTAFCTKVFFAAFFYLQLGFVIFLTIENLHKSC